MRLPFAMFFVLLLMLLLLVLTATQPEPRGAIGRDHPDYQAMQQGGENTERHAHVYALGVLWGLLQILFFTLCLTLGIGQEANIRALGLLLVSGGGLYGAAYLVMTSWYPRYVDASAPQQVLAFPLPTAVMLFGVGLAPLFFIVLYVAGFHRWIITRDELDRFNELVRAGKIGNE